jgi:MFS family permease
MSGEGTGSGFARLICAIGVGNALEWFDFAIYGALADIIGYHFFPAHRSQTALLASFSVYSSTFLMRPLGGIVMGYIGDNFGRKFALELSISLMVVPGFIMGCLPTFHHIGYLATVFLIALRMLQGLAVGGEMIGAYIFTIEACEPTQRGLWGTAQHRLSLTHLSLPLCLSLSLLVSRWCLQVHRSVRHSAGNGLRDDLARGVVRR